MPDRYEINHDGEIVVGNSALCRNQTKLLQDLFSQYNWTCTEESKEGACHRLKLTHAGMNTKMLNVYSGTIRNESRNAYEKKIQLGGSDPRNESKEDTIILGIYVYDRDDSYRDAIFVGYPIDENFNYDRISSIRGTFVQGILIQAKRQGFVYDKVHNTVGFRAEFVYYYLANYYDIHYNKNIIPQMDDTVVETVNCADSDSSEIVFHTGFISDKARNRILFGAPGTGKSYTLNKERKNLLGEDNETDYERVTFHPDYSYAHFVGTYKPVPCIDSEGKDAITYEYVPGPFMRILVKALKNGKNGNVKPYLLIIEEINRANVAAVFGDVFQLLDRSKDDVSEYPIEASEDMKKYLATELGGQPDNYSKIMLPDNMFIWATMNSADQGVFPMDTAFKRRWEFDYIGIDDNDEDIRGKTVVLGSTKSQRIEWNKLRKAINNFLARQRINEDKQLGAYFIARDIVAPESGNVIDEKEFTKTFKNKVIMYLFEDAAKQKRNMLFQGCSENSSRYSEICKEFDEKGIGIFHADIQQETEPENLPDQAAD